MKKLETKGITYSIDGKIIIDGIDISVKEGEFVGIVGPNGCGKSTLLKNIYKVFTPDSGAAFIDGVDLSKLSNRKTAKKMSVMQQENIVDFDMTVYDMVMLGRFAHQKLFSGSSEEDREIVSEYIKEVGLSGYEKRHFLSLSGGEKQRTLLARALSQKTPVILLDEPTNHLDIGYQYQIMNILKRQSLTILCCVHDLNIAATYCDRLVLMKNKKIFDVGSPKEMLTRENIRALFDIDTMIIENEKTGRLNIIFMPEL